MRKVAIIAMLFGILALSGCGESEHTVSWYKDHPDVAQKKADECKDDTAKEVTSDCQNAIKANTDKVLYGDGSFETPDISIGSDKSGDADKNGE